MPRRRAVARGLDPATLAYTVRAEQDWLERRDPGVLAEHACRLAGAQAALLQSEPGGPAVRAGSRAGEAALRAAFDGAAGQVALYRLDPAGRIGFTLPADERRDDERLQTVADWVAGRLAQGSVLAESDRAARAELRALRAQISPHFTFNAMGAIAALIRIDPDRAHALLLDFADFTRYSFGRHGEYTTLAEELRATEIYLSLERARFGDRLGVHVLVAPEVLSVAVPFLVLQPLVENAIRHGIEPSTGGGAVRVEAADEGDVVRIEVDDDGAGADAAQLAGVLAGAAPVDARRRGHVGLRNIDERLRAVYGDCFGLLVDTAPGAGTKVTVRIPKYRPEVMA